MKYLLLAVLIAAAVIGTMYNFLIPIGAGPDEPAHLSYVEIVAEEFRLPDHEDTYQAHHPPLYYLGAAVIYRATPFLTPDGRRHAVRVLSLLLVMGAALLTAAAAARALPQWPAAAPLAAAGVAFHPLLAYESGVVNNDAAAVFIFSLFLYAAVRLLYGDGAMDVRRSALFGLVTGAALLTKSNLIFLPLLFIVMFIRRRPGGARTCLFSLAAYGLAAATVCGWWYAHNYLAYGSLLPHTTTAEVQQQLSWAVILFNLDMMIEPIAVICRRTYYSFWAPLWIVRQFMSMQLLTIVTALLATTTAVGLVVMHRRGARLMPVVALFLISLTVMITAIIAFALKMDLHVHEGGRFLLGITAAFGLTGGIGWSGLLPRRGLPAAVWPVLLLLALNIGCLNMAQAYYRTNSP